ncbi:c-type cytochrome [Saprospira grandis]|uniref:Cytochrome c class i n=1 Tax=Saprospira grandis (strain Lewin) TaxID=984262 RepID=H6KZF0_SAPGL|nr:cytochrome c [Saprospira grandis]AFC25726.1 cytochrome c class i [Saprospira grandis str. Lewin]
MRPIFLLSFLLLGLFACEQPNAYGDGAMLYEKHCANCHGDQGEGLEELIPPLAQADALMQAGTAAACWVRYGLHGPILVNGQEFDNEMPENKALSAVEITNVLNYVRNSWGNKGEFLQLDQVQEQLLNCQK